MRKGSLLIAAFLVSIAGVACWAGPPISPSSEEINQAVSEAEEYRSSLGEVLERARENKEAQRRAAESHDKFQEQVLPRVQEWKDRIKKVPGLTFDVRSSRPRTSNVEHGKAVSEGHERTLHPDERLYIFMSSSVPKAVWKGYAEDLDRLREPNAVMVLRGCIGGCRYIRPTLEFIQSVVAPEGEDGRKLSAQIWIDPFLFRFYGVKRVPCVVYARGVHPLADASEGTMKNLKSKPTWAMSCGDWALEYHLRELYRKTKAPALKAFIEALKESWYAGKKN